MNTNPPLSNDLVSVAGVAYLHLMDQLDILFSHATFYVERYPCATASDVMKTVELARCINELARLPTELGEVVKNWKQGIPNSISREGVELDLLNEIWANTQGLIYFLVSHDIAVEPFDVDAATKSFYQLVQANRSLT